MGWNGLPKVVSLTMMPRLHNEDQVGRSDSPAPLVLFNSSSSVVPGSPRWLSIIPSKLEVAPNALKMWDWTGVDGWMDGYPLDCYDY